MVTFLTTALFLWVGARQVLDGQLTIGAPGGVQRAGGAGQRPDHHAAAACGTTSSSPRVLLDRLDDVFEQEPEQGRDRSRLLPVRTLEGRISLRNVGFRYGGPGVAADPRRASRSTCRPGKMVAIVGRSGSGKTTLVKCLAGLLEPTEGTILYDGVDLQDAQLPRPAPADRLRAAGELSLRRHDRPQHRLRRGRARHGPGDLGGAGGQRARVHRAPAARLRHARSASRASPSPAASASASPSPARSTTSRRCSSSTRRPARSTPSPSGR